MQFIASSRRGFTLIEIMIVIMIIVSMTGFVTANYAMFSEEKKLNDDAAKIRSVMSLARASAVSGDLGPYPCEPFVGYQVSFSSAESPNQFTLRVCCNASCSESGTPPSYTVNQYKLNSNITIPTDFAVLFRPYASGTNLNDNYTVVLRNTFINKCHYVTITPIGVIESGKLYDC